jgi:hypothetical protein
MEKLANLPPPVKWVLAITGIGALIGSGSALTSGKWAFLVMLLILLVVVLGGYLLWVFWNRKKRNAQLNEDLGGHGKASPRGISDPGQRARLDDMRKKFESGVAEYRSRGKDLYKLPWYVIVGEPGSGKTEAIRHSNVGFPPGMQDEFQGVGGTINMNWWFTNHAVLLDTAGRLMFEKVKPGETSEWKEFHTLLKKNRPNCPINGLFLVIPSDSLIKDSADDIARKAGKIAQQLDVIQRILDVRFPVFVIVTKCDKVIGFREFFDGLTDPQLQHQMMGWSNPDPLDTAFRPELVDQHLDKVLQRLRRRRLGLLRDPVSENQSGRRTDEVDSLYALPHTLSTLAPRLRRYLETIFIAGEWSAKPLFLRGIYFSSAMREGSALDEDLAKAIGVPVDDLPEGKVWERDRAFFLRDLFIDKVFKERGLVTRANNTSRMLRTQQLALFVFVFIALAIFLGVAALGKKRLETEVKNRSDIWVAATDWSNDKTWKQSIIPREGENYADRAINRLQVNGRDEDLGTFYLKLQESATNQLKNSWMLAGVADKYNKNSQRAQRIVFEGGVIKPLVEAVRQKMLTPGRASQKSEGDVLATLIRLEAECGGKGTNAGTIDPELAGNFLASLLSYATGQDRALDATTFSNLVSSMVWTYSLNETARNSWPPAWLSESGKPTDQLAILAGLDRFARAGATALDKQMEDWGAIDAIRNECRRFEEHEVNLFKAAQTNDAAGAKANFAKLKEAHLSLNNLLQRATNSDLFQNSPSLDKASSKFRNTLQANKGIMVAKVKAANDKALADNPANSLFKEVQKRLTDLEHSFETKLSRIASPGDTNEFQRFDARDLLNESYKARWALYQSCQDLSQAKPFQASGLTLVGQRGSALTRFEAESVEPVKQRVEFYKGPASTEAAAICNYLLGEAKQSQRKAFVAAYLQEANGRLKGRRRFPLVKPTDRSLKSPLSVAELKSADTDLASIKKDLEPEVLKNFSAGQQKELTDFAEEVKKLSAVCTAILDDEQRPIACTISLSQSGESTETADHLIPNGWRYIKLRADSGVTNRAVETGDTSKDSPLGSLLGIDQPFNIELSKDVSDSKSPVSGYPAALWGGLQWIHQFPASTSDRKTWSVRLPLHKQDGVGVIALKLSFSRALPVLADWPSE